MKFQYSKHHTPAPCKGTSNNRNLQVFRKINREISDKFKQNGLSIDDFEHQGTETTFYAHTRGRSATCPCCGRKSSSVKAYRPRKFQDTEFLGSHSTLIVETRLFRCSNKKCEKQSFAEPLKIAQPYARMTNDVNRRVEYASLNQSARLASNSLALQNIKVSKSTCIRKATKFGERNPDVICSGYVAIDDWAFRKGHTYMCSIVDHYTGRVLAVFDDRYPMEVVRWLQAHPEVKLVSRDGSRDYANLIRMGRPEAVQVTDRFHLIKNLKETMVEAIRDMLGHKKEKQKYPYPDEEEALRLIKEDIAEMGDARHRSKVQDYLRIRQLQEEGKSVSGIAKSLGLKSHRVYTLGNLHISSVLSKEQKKALEYSRELAALVASGTISINTLVSKMKDKLESKLVYRCMRKITAKYSVLRRLVRENNKKLEATGKCAIIRKDVIWHYILTGQTTSEKLHKLKVTHPHIDQVINSCINFRNMIAFKDDSPDVDDWIKGAKQCHCDELYRFAEYIESDKEAVRQAYETNYSNGIKEGTVNKIKEIKRSMFNRAGVKLLRAKIIYADYGRTAPYLPLN